MVGETLGSVLQVDKVGIRRGDSVQVRIDHGLTTPVKQVFPPTEFEFSAGVAAMLRFRYDHFVGFCKICGLLEHRLSGCGGLVPAVVEVVANTSSNPKPNPTSIFGSRQGSLSLGPSSGLSIGDAGLVFKAQLLFSTGGSASCSIAFHHSGAFRGKPSLPSSTLASTFV